MGNGTVLNLICCCAKGGLSMKKRSELNIIEQLYILEVLKGVVLTFGRLVRNLVIYVFNCMGLCKSLRPWVTVEYPNDIKSYPPRFRGRHRLTVTESGGVKCTACFLCATACPASCIYIEPQEHSDPNIEKFPARYEINTLMCVYCGYCVEACPVDAIRMDTGLHPEVYGSDPSLFIEDKQTLMARSYVIENEGVHALLKKHLDKMKQIERCPFE